VIANTTTTTTTTTTTATTKAATVTYKASCKLASNKKSVSCTVSSSSTKKFTGTIRLQGKTTGAVSKGSKSRKAKLTLKSGKALKKGQKVVLKITSGKTTKVLTVKAS
jgi:hypothetical protein